MGFAEQKVKQRVVFNKTKTDLLLEISQCIFVVTSFFIIRVSEELGFERQPSIHPLSQAPTDPCDTIGYKAPISRNSC